MAKRLEKGARFHVRIEPWRKVRFQGCAEADGMDFSAWAIRAIEFWIKKHPEGAPAKISETKARRRRPQT